LPTGRTSSAGAAARQLMANGRSGEPIELVLFRWFSDQSSDLQHVFEVIVKGS
jgi:hypothetical protein